MQLCLQRGADPLQQSGAAGLSALHAACAAAAGGARAAQDAAAAPGVALWLLGEAPAAGALR